MKKQVFVLIWLLFLIQYSFAQEINEHDLLQKSWYELEPDHWTSTLLNASKNALYNAVVYNGQSFNWSFRGENNYVTNLDQINLESPLGKIKFSSLLNGIQNEFYKTDISVNGAFSRQGYNVNPIVNYISTALPSVLNNVSFANAFSSSNNTNILKVHFNSGIKINKLNYSIAMVMQNRLSEYSPIGYKQSIGLLYTAERLLQNNSKLGFSLIWNYSNQSRAATAVNEAIELSGTRSYNPSWGWYHNKIYFPNTRQSNAPLFLFKYEKKWSDNNYIIITNAIVVGTQSQSGLEWTQATDPRPDYYRYLPSYITDSGLQKSLKNWYLQHPQLLQTNFDKLEKTNLLSAEKRSFYIVSQQNTNLLLGHGSVTYSKQVSSYFEFLTGVRYAFEKLHSFNTIKDLIGGTYYYNYNNWINDDGIATSFQNDILNPNRKINLNEKWGANFFLKSVQLQPWFEIAHYDHKIESHFALGFGLQGLQRDGLNENGLFPANSKGPSSIIFQNAANFKAQVLYKFSGRTYLRAIAYLQNQPATAEATYINYDLNAFTSPYWSSVLKRGIDLSFFYRAPQYKITASIYWNNSFNNSVKTFFYHDAYAQFVYGVIGDIAKQNTGAELSVETSIFDKIQLSYVSNYQHNIFLNNPKYQLLQANDFNNVSGSLLYLSNLAATSIPNFTNSLNLIFQFNSTASIGLDFVYAMERAMFVDYFRRSDFVKTKIDAYSWNDLLANTYLPNSGAINAFASKRFMLKRPNKLYKYQLSISARNILNTPIPVIAYEQTRFDYVHFNANKYAPKYLYDMGANYSIRFQLQIQ